MHSRAAAPAKTGNRLIPALQSGAGLSLLHSPVKERSVTQV